MRCRKLAILVAALAAWGSTSPGTASAQILEKVAESVEDETERQVQNEVEAQIAGLFRCVWNDLECIRGAEEDGEEVALTDEDGEVLLDEEGRPVSDPEEAETLMSQEASGTAVGTVEMVADGRSWTFDVREGPMDEGFTTGYSEQPRAGAMVMGAALQGWHRDSDARIEVSVGVWSETMEHMCDPFANQVRFSPAGERAGQKRLRPAGDPSETCPPPPDGGRGGLAVHINLTEATLDAEAGTLHVVGTFTGPLGRGDDALQVTEGRFEATLRPYGEL